MKFKCYSLPKALLISGCMLLAADASAQLPPLQQCSPSLIPSFVNGCGSGGYIASLTTTGGINNITNNNTNCGNTATSYSDYTSTTMKVTQEALKSVDVKITWVGTPSTNPANVTSTLTKIYIDWNRDGLFHPVDEYIAPASTSQHVQSSNSTLTIKVTVPGSAKNGLTRMRIVTGAQINSTYDFNTSACGTANYGEAEDYVFEVINPCVPPNTISVANMDYKSADFSWTEKLNAEMYEYVITPVDTIPHDTVVGFTFTTNKSVDVDTFKCNTKYYVLVRVICDTAGLSAKYWKKSAWIRDSFTTHQCCDAPKVTVDNVTSTTARYSWQPVSSAFGYEYAVSTTPDPPQQGTYTTSTMVFQQGLTPKTTYFVHVRSRCSPTPLSNWTKEPFKTLKTTSVDDVERGMFSINVYPNPVKDVINVTLNGQHSTNAVISVIDLTGKIVYSAPVNSEAVTIDASGLSSGIYIVKYTDDVHNEIMKVTK